MDPHINTSHNSYEEEEEEEVVIQLASTHPKRRAGRKKFKETRHPVYRGVRMRNSDRWVCELREPTHQKRIWLGTYPTAEMAARAHDVAALALRGQAACLNFADSVSRLPVPASNDPEDIRKAAGEAAEAFRPTTAAVAQEMIGFNENAAAGEGSSGNVGFGGSGDFGVCGAGEGALMSPPPPSFEFEGRFDDDDVESDAEVELWNYSF